MRRWRELCAALAGVGLSGAIIVACAGGSSTSVPDFGGDGSTGDATTTEGGPAGDSSAGGDGTTTSDSASKDSGAKADTGGGGEEDASDAGQDSGCTAPTTLCIDVCVDLQTNPFNCGQCGRFCATGLVCSNGACVPNCPVGQSLCAFDGGLVEAGAPDAEVDSAPPEDSAAPVDSGEPDGGWGSGLFCATLPSDPQNCGMCNNQCFQYHDTPSCVNGVCGIGSCNPGYANCSGNPQTGCETNIGNDTNNCGSCGNACNLPNATATCVANAAGDAGGAGTCEVGACSPGWGNCDNNPANGCETNTTNSPTNCGTCNNACPSGPQSTPVCTNSVCKIVCSAGYADCDGNPANGCEVNTGSNSSNCGSCGNACSTNNATEACTGGTCHITACAPGFADCDSNPANGCETNTSTNVNNCGVCGEICSTANGTPACTAGMCGIASCNPGYAHCASTGTNCETSTGTDPDNCGGCGNACSTNHDTPSCTGGMCSIACSSGWANCDGVESNGCETQLGTTSNCASCGNACTTSNGTPACVISGAGASCAVGSCNTGYQSCPGDGTNCSTNIETDNNNCGACGQVCDVATCGGGAGHVASTSCTGGTCDITSCEAGWTYTSNVCGAAGDCECAVSTVPTTCGAGSYNLGTEPVGANPVTFTSNLYPAAPNDAYFAVTFTGNTDTGSGSPSYSGGYHPKITISDPLNEFVMDITSNCSTIIAACNTAGDASEASGVTTWEVQYTAGDPTSYPISGSHFDAIPAVGNGGLVYVRVYRKAGVTNCNNAYTITVTNQ